MNLVKLKRKELKLTQKDLAGIIGVDRTTITKLEKKGKTSVRTAKAIAEVLGIDWTLFFETQK